MSEYKITNESGCPVLHIDGVATPPVVYALSDFPGAKSNTAYAQKNIKNFGDAGVNLVAVDIDLRHGWRKTEPFDAEPLITEISSVLDANPKAKVLIRLHVNAPYWWELANPDECCIYRTFEGDKKGLDMGEEYVRLIRTDKFLPQRASVASKKWVADVCENIKHFLEALKSTPEGDALMAIQPAYGLNGEWHSFGTDVSVPMKARFKKYLKDTYKTDEALKAAWNDPDVTIETAEFHPETFRKGDDGAMRDPRCSQNTTDSQRSFQIATAEAIVAFCRAAKSVMPNILCGSFYGYYIGTGGNNMTIGGHLAMDTIYDAKDAINFLAGPFCYMDNRKSDGVPMQRALLESQRLNGMLWLTEMDQAPFGTELYVGGDPERFDESVCVLRRNALQPLLAGEGFWFYDHRLVPSMTIASGQNTTASSIFRKNGWWDTPELMAEAKKLKEFADKLKERPYKSSADILLVFDLDSYYYRSRVLDGEYNIIAPLARAGAVFNCIYSRDIEKCDMSQYKCVIFVNCFKISDDRRKVFDSLTKGKTVVYLNNHGYCDGKTLSEDNISSAVGMTLKKSEAKTVLIEDSAQKEIPDDIRPIFAVCDREAKPLALYDNGEVAAAQKGNKIYIPTAALSPSLAEHIVEASGAHRWCDSGEPILAGYGYAAIICQKAGTRRLTLPSGKTIDVKTDGFATYVYDINTGECVLK